MIHPEWPIEHCKVGKEGKQEQRAKKTAAKRHDKSGAGQLRANKKHTKEKMDTVVTINKP